MRLERSSLSNLRTMFKRTGSSSPCRNNPSLLRQCRVNGFSRCRRQRVMLSMKPDISHLFHANRLKSPQPHVQSKRLNPHTLLPDPIQYLRRKVQPRCRRRSRPSLLSPRLLSPRLLSINSLIARLVLGRIRRVFRTVDIRRQRHVTNTIQNLQKFWRMRKAQRALSKIPRANNLSFENRQRLSRSELSRKCRRSPGCTFRPGRTSADHVFGSICCVSSTSIRPVGSGELCWVCSPARVA